MKWIIDSRIKHDSNAILLEKEYFCIFEEECTFGYATHSEVILKNEDSSSRYKEDNFVPPVTSRDDQSDDSGFVPPVNTETTDTQVSHSHSFPQQNNLHQVLLLFVKADSGNNIITALKSEMKLSSKYSDDLYIETMNLWVGTEKEFDTHFAVDFSQEDSKGDIPKLDFVILQIQLYGDFNGYKKGDSSVERINFFKQICDKKLTVSRISRRLNFTNSKGASISWEK